MRFFATVLLAGCFVLLGMAVSSVLAEDPAPAKTPSDQDLTKGLKEASQAAETTKSDPATTDGATAKDGATADAPPKPPTPAEQKLAGIEKIETKAKEALAKIPAIETKINEAIGKLTDSAKKPVELKVLQTELAENRPSQAARTYKEYELTLAGAYEQVKGLLLQGLKQTIELSKMANLDEAVKSKNEELQTSLKQQCIDVLTKLVAIYERIGDQGRVEASYKQMLALDKENAAAVAFFKELEAKKKERNTSSESSSGGGGHYNTGRPSYGR